MDYYKLLKLNTMKKTTGYNIYYNATCGKSTNIDTKHTEEQAKLRCDDLNNKMNKFVKSKGAYYSYKPPGEQFKCK